MADPEKPDIVARLKSAAYGADDMLIEDIEALFNEAAKQIETLRILVGIRQEIELEDAEPEGNA